MIILFFFLVVALKVGDMVDVKLLDVDFDKKRISLSMKALLNDDAE